MKSAIFANIPRPFPIGDRKFLVSGLSGYEWAIHQAWIEDNIPAPEPPEGSDNIERMLWNRAWPPRPISVGWWDALDHPGCWPAFVKLALSKHEPGGISDAESIVLGNQILDLKLISPLVLRCMGEDPEAKRAKSADREIDESSFRPEEDEVSDVYFDLAKNLGWSHDQCLHLTMSQVRFYQFAGKPPRPGSRKFKSSADARSVNLN